MLESIMVAASASVRATKTRGEFNTSASVDGSSAGEHPTFSNGETSRSKPRLQTDGDQSLDVLLGGNQDLATHVSASDRDSRWQPLALDRFPNGGSKSDKSSRMKKRCSHMPISGQYHGNKTSSCSFYIFLLDSQLWIQQKHHWLPRDISWCPASGPRCESPRRRSR